MVAYAKSMVRLIRKYTPW